MVVVFGGNDRHDVDVLWMIWWWIGLDW